MNYFPFKQAMTLRDYLGSSCEPNWRLKETDDYIVYNDSFYSGLSILIDRDAYCATKNDRNVFFDMLRLNYTLPFSYDFTIIKYGNYFEDEHGAFFFLTEPKHAEDVLISDRFFNHQRLFKANRDSREVKYIHKFAFVLSTDAKLYWDAKYRHGYEFTTYNYGKEPSPSSVRTLRDYAMKENQHEFELALATFYLS